MLQSEWEKVKNLIYSNADWEKKLKSTSWKALNRSHSDQLPNVLGLIDLILTIPASTAECERGFSGMKRVKSDWRARLNTSTLSDLMLVLLEGPSIDDFEPLRACQLWADHCDRRPIKRSANRKSGHGKKRKTHQIQLPLLVVLLPLPLLVQLLLKTTLKLGLSRWWRK